MHIARLPNICTFARCVLARRNMQAEAPVVHHRGHARPPRRRTERSMKRSVNADDLRIGRTVHRLQCGLCALRILASKISRGKFYQA
jgi:hypothetical protein